jgi:hypothetical protein
MMQRTHSHPDSSHLVEIDGRKLVLFHCVSCGREFARKPVDSEWRAAYVGPFHVTFLADAISQQWVSEPCPGGGDAATEALPELSHSPVFSESQNELVRLPAFPAARRRRRMDQPAESVEMAPAIAPTEETVKARPNHGGRPSKVRFLPTFAK